MSIEKITSNRSQSFAAKLKEFLADADLVEVSIKDSSETKIVGKLLEVFYDDKTGTTWVSIRKPYDVDICKIKLESGESITAHKTRTLRVW